MKGLLVSVRPFLSSGRRAFDGQRLPLIPILRSVVFGVLLTFVAYCQHAHAELSPALMVRQNTVTRQAKTNDTWILDQNYFLFGLYPRKMTYSEEELCPRRGILSIHQYYSASNIVVEQITLGLYSPRVIEIKCHP